MGESKKLNGYYNYTVVLTYMGMLIGFTGVIEFVILIMGLGLKI